MENEILGQILAELQKLNVRQDGMDQRLDRMEQRLDGMEQRLNSMERQQNSLAEELTAFQEYTMQKFENIDQRLDRLEKNQQRTNLAIENELRPSIQALAEGQLTMQLQLDRIEAQVTVHDEILFKRVK